MGKRDTILVHFHPRFPHNLANLLNIQTAEEGEPAGSSDQQTPLIIGDSAKFREVIGLVHRYAPYDITVLITGETGTGKEVMARYIHEHSARRDGPLVACNMTAIPETLVESELFGYVKGAFTGAERNKKGLIETAEGGSLFLDEIGDLPLAIQLKLLRFLESREFYRVGESTPKTANVRIIAATNKQMERAIQEQRFREDLYYRLNSARVILPLAAGTARGHHLPRRALYSAMLSADAKTAQKSQPVRPNPLGGLLLAGQCA
jgi:transcriptional regulator with PAS, ATPase and Fis domain